MAVNIATLAVKFIADTTGLKAGSLTAGNMLKVLGGSASNLGGVFSGLTSQMGGLASAFGTAGPAGLAIAGTLAAVGAGAYGAYKAFNQFLDSAERIDKTSKLAERLDLTYGSLQRLSFIAGRSDVEIGALAKAMEHMGRTMGSGGLSLEARFDQQAKRIGAIKDPALRASEAFKTFGKAGGELIPLLKNFAQDAARFDRFGGKFGFGIEDKDAKNIERMNDAWGDLVFIGTQLVDKFVSKFGGPVAAFLETIIDLTVSWADHLAELGITWDDVGGFAVSVMGTLAEQFTYANGSLKTMVGFLEQVYGAHQKIAGILSGDNALIGKGEANIKSGRKLIKSGINDIDDVFSGKSRQRFEDRITNGTDFGKRGFGGSSDFGGEKLSHPAALERGSAGAISAVLAAGGNPLHAVQENTKLLVDKMVELILVERGKREVTFAPAKI